MRFASICDGISAVGCAWKPLGWSFAFKSEIEPFPGAVADFHHPEAPNLGNMLEHKHWNDYRIELICGGTPCQAFSLAGLRKGLADPRGNLTLGYLGILEQYRPRWMVWENVPGVLSDRTGAFGAFLGGLAKLGYGFSYRILDAQYFGVAQRRRRVFVVGHLGDWRRAAAVLFERESLRWNPPPRREAGQGFTFDVAPVIGASGRGFSRCGETRGQDPVIAVSAELSGTQCATTENLSPALTAGPMAVAHTLRGAGFDASEDGTGRGTPLVCMASGQANAEIVKDGVPSLTRLHEAPIVFNHPAVRRLTPRECERLQGFADDYTLVLFRKKPAADGPRYKALGNSMAVPVMRWIGERIQRVDALP